MATRGAVAVIIPAHNRRHTVTKAIGSVLGQTYRDLQCIVVDNGSNDDTGEALGTLGDPRLTVLSEPRPLGPSLARNVGVSVALGASWVTFLDSDDYWAPDKVEQQMKALAHFPAGAMVRNKRRQCRHWHRRALCHQIGVGSAIDRRAVPGTPG